MLIPESPLLTAARPIDGSARSFFGVLVGLIVVDVILLFCLLNPFTRLNSGLRSYPLVERAASLAMGRDAKDAPKPSPFGLRERSTASSTVMTTPAFLEVNK